MMIVLFYILLIFSFIGNTIYINELNKKDEIIKDLENRLINIFNLVNKSKDYYEWFSSN